MSYWRNKGLNVSEYLYDFSDDGGATGEIILSNKAGNDPLPIGAIVEKVSLHVTTAFTSGGSATLTVGNDADADGYIKSIAVASLTDNAVFSGGSEGGDLIWDDTNDHPIDYYVSSAANGEVDITIGTAAMTAGACTISVYWRYGTVA